MTSVDQSQSREINGMPSITVLGTYDELSRRAADAVVETISAHPASAITVPTGSTPLGMYQELVRRIEDGAADFAGVQIFCLDDYLGQTPEDQASLTGWLKREFLDPGRIPAGNIHYIPTTADDPHAAAEQYEDDIRDHGGLELAVVGLGPNGHVAFNEPGSDPDSRTRVVGLTEESRDQNAAYYEGNAQIPQRAITMGLGTILTARRIVMIVSGAAKADIVRHALEGPMTSDVPGSWMRLAGSKLEVLLDADAASALSGAKT
jgi:glucosamine-6-phosphate deaminase